jgi:hypothetical protein
MCREGAVEIDGINHRFCWTDGDSEALCVCSNKHAVRENKVEFPNVSCPNCGRMHGIGHFTPDAAEHHELLVGFLPPHGRRLEANEEFVVFGSIYDAIVPFERSGARRNIVAFENALRRGDLEIVSTPAPILENQHGHTKMVILTNDNTLSAVDPCWETSLSTSDDADFN